MKKFQNFNLQFSYFNLNWNFHQFTNQVFLIFKLIKIERTDFISIIMLWFFWFFQKKTSFFSNLFTHLFLIFHMFLNVWHNKSWHILMFFCSAHKSNQKKENLKFFCAEKLSALSCLIIIKLQWSFIFWIISYIIWAFCELISIFLFF